MLEKVKFTLRTLENTGKVRARIERAVCMRDVEFQAIKQLTTSLNLRNQCAVNDLFN